MEELALFEVRGREGGILHERGHKPRLQLKLREDDSDISCYLTTPLKLLEKVCGGPGILCLP